MRNPSRQAALKRKAIMIIANGTQIRDLTPDGLWYIAETGEPVYIDYADCHANYVKKTTTPEYIEQRKAVNPQSQWDEEGIKQFIARRIAWKEIGRIQVLGPPWDDEGPYIEFHTELPIRFKFGPPESMSKVKQSIWPTLFDRKWKLFDLS